MPTSLPEWMFFAWFFIGSVGGWVLMVVLLVEVWIKFRMRSYD